VRNFSFSLFFKLFVWKGSPAEKRTEVKKRHEKTSQKLSGIRKPGTSSRGRPQAYGPLHLEKGRVIRGSSDVTKAILAREGTSSINPPKNWRVLVGGEGGEDERTLSFLRKRRRSVESLGRFRAPPEREKKGGSMAGSSSIERDIFGRAITGKRSSGIMTKRKQASPGGKTMTAAKEA